MRDEVEPIDDVLPAGLTIEKMEESTTQCADGSLNNSSAQKMSYSGGHLALKLPQLGRDL